ncbi:MAG TPA: hypothetical protein VFE97_09815 [Methylomirabilota bacterium]|nr:hypothetical protein [Methylomirabilota bacterium]
MIKRVVGALFAKPKATYCMIRVTDNANFVVRMLTPEACAWAEQFLGEPLPNGDRIVSGAVVLVIAGDAVARGYLVRFV